MRWRDRFHRRSTELNSVRSSSKRQTKLMSRKYSLKCSTVTTSMLVRNCRTSWETLSSMMNQLKMHRSNSNSSNSIINNSSYCSIIIPTASTRVCLTHSTILFLPLVTILPFQLWDSNAICVLLTTSNTGINLSSFWGKHSAVSLIQLMPITKKMEWL